MQQWEYRDNKKILGKFRVKINVTGQEPEEVDCLVTESHIVFEAKESIKIPIEHIKKCDIWTPSIYTHEFTLSPVKPQKPLYDTAKLTLLNESNEEQKLSFNIAGGKGYSFKNLIDTQIAEYRFLSSFKESTEVARRPAQDDSFKQFSRTLKERFLDKTRDDICDGLQMLGIEAKLSKRGRIEEMFCGGVSLGIIDIRKSPINWVNIREEQHAEAPSIQYFADYGIPDIRLGQNSFLLRIETVRVKNIPLVGRVVDLRWRGEELNLGIINRLNSDSSLKHPIMKSRDLTITANGKYGCWIISTETDMSPSSELWSCYEAIARHLLTEWPK